MPAHEALTGLPSRYTRKSVSLIPEKRRPCGAEDILLIWGPAHPCCTDSRMRGLVTFHRHGAWAGGSECELAEKAGQNQGRTVSYPGYPMPGMRPQPVTQHPPSHPPSLFLGSMSWEKL